MTNVCATWREAVEFIGSEGELAVFTRTGHAFAKPDRHPGMKQGRMVGKRVVQAMHARDLLVDAKDPGDYASVKTFVLREQRVKV